MCVDMNILKVVTDKFLVSSPPVKLSDQQWVVNYLLGEILNIKMRNPKSFVPACKEWKVITTSKAVSNVWSGFVH